MNYNPPKYRTDYYPFLSSIKSRGYSAGSGFRFGFNTQEKDKEIYKNNETYTATFWEYDGRLGRRWNVDKITKSWLNSFGCFSNNPLCMVYHDGNADFYSQNGQKVGSDGNADGKIYILTSEEDVKKSNAIYFGTGVKGFFAMLRENGGKGTFHVHPNAGDKGMNFQDMSSSNDGYHISPTPSLRDVENATQGGNTEAYNIVIGMADNTVYFYGTQKQNQEGVNFRASFPSKLFFQLGKSNENEKK